MENSVNKVMKSYPNSKNQCISEAWKIGEGWCRLWGVNLPNLTDKMVEKLDKEGYTMVNICLVDEWGTPKLADFTIKELKESNQPSGTFSSKDECVDELKNQCFKFSHIYNGYMYFTKESTKDIAMVHVYKDGTASAMIGKYR